MNALREAEKIVASLTRSEKIQLVQDVTRELEFASPGIEKTPGICGGDSRVAGTRIPIWLLEQARRLGSSEAEILQSYFPLRAEDLVNAWAYVRAHREEIERLIDDNEMA